jgi:hypothetical protein
VISDSNCSGIRRLKCREEADLLQQVMEY